MHNQNLGRVAVIGRGEYDPAAHYDRLDAVSYGGSSYLVRKPCQGITPVVGEYYMLMARAGATGQTGAKGDAGDIGPVGPKGDKGDTGNDGADGKDGLSPTVTVSDITGGHRVTITDADGAKTVDVMDGEPGADGAPGRNGADGRTPVYGTDYATPDQIKEIAAQAAQVLEPEVNKLKSDLSNKEPLHKILSATLVTGETTLTFTDDSITDNALIYIYTDVWGVQPSAVEQSVNTLILTFDAQSADLGVKVEVR